MTARTIFRFRLATLLLVVFSLATGALIWLRWEPWHLEFSSSEVMSKSDDDHWLVLRNEQVYELHSVLSHERKRLPFDAMQMPLRDVSISSRWGRIVALDDKYNVQVWELETFRPLALFKIDPDEWIAAYAIQPQVVISFGKSGWVLRRIEGGTIVKLRSSSHTDVRVSHCNRFISDSSGVYSTTTGEQFLGSEVRAELLVGNGQWTDKALSYKGRRPFVFDLAENKAYPVLEPVPSRNGIQHYELRGSYLCQISNDPPDDQHISAWDYKTGRLVDVNLLPVLNDFIFTVDRQRYFFKYFKAGIYDSSSRGKLFELPNYEYASHSPLFTPNREAVVIDKLDNTLEVWSRRHPEWWWGHFYRPEVWLGLLLSGVWLLKLRGALRRRWMG
jgi:WD40 repeat protein